MVWVHGNRKCCYHDRDAGPVVVQGEGTDGSCFSIDGVATFQGVKKEGGKEREREVRKKCGKEKSSSERKGRSYSTFFFHGLLPVPASGV
jgi:hypothetical protein